MRHDQPSAVASGKPSNMCNCSLYNVCSVYLSCTHSLSRVCRHFVLVLHVQSNISYVKFRITRLPWSPGWGVGNLAIYVTCALHIQMTHSHSSITISSIVFRLWRLGGHNAQSRLSQNARNASIFRRTHVVATMYAWLSGSFTKRKHICFWKRKYQLPRFLIRGRAIRSLYDVLNGPSY